MSWINPLAPIVAEYVGKSAGSAAKHPEHAQEKINDFVDNGPLGFLSGVKDLSQASVEVLRRLTSVGLWKRVGVGVLGFYLVYWGILLFLSQTKTGKSAIGAGVNAAKVAVTKGAV